MVVSGPVSLVEDLEQRCARGLADAGDRLLGNAPEEVCAAFAGWQRSHERDLPWLAGPVWSALAPLGIEMPDDGCAATLSRLLVGVEVDPARARQAVERCRVLAGPTPEWRPLPTSGELVGELWRRALASAVAEYWEVLADCCGQVHPAVVEGRRDDAEALLRACRLQLIGIAERISILAHRAVGAAPRSRLAPEPPPPVAIEPPPDEWGPTLTGGGPSVDDLEATGRMDPPTPPPESSPVQPSPAPAAGSEATAPAPAVTAPQAPVASGRTTAPAGRPAPRRQSRHPTEYRVVRDRKFAPVVFLVLLTGGALYYVAALALHWPLPLPLP